VSRYYATTLGVRSTLPAKEILTSQQGTDGLWHAHDARDRLGGELRQPPSRSEPLKDAA
jgi:hypothetical protein